MRRLLLITLLAGAAACSEPRKEASISQTIPNLPLPPLADLVSRQGGEDALQLRFRSRMSPDSLADHYRGVLSRAPWRLVSDVRTADGAIALYAEQDGPPLWVSIRKADGTSGSFVDLAGAEAAGARKPAAPVAAPANPQ